jgi:competence ComEA-like helix-hairpin-helix protein
MRHPGTRHGDGLRLLTLLVVLCFVAIIVRALTSARLDGPGMSPPDMRIGVNTASEAELGLLPGIGPALAARIAADREANGPFPSVDDLERVSRIGPVTVEHIRPFVVADPPEEASPAEENR